MLQLTLIISAEQVVFLPRFLSRVSIDIAIIPPFTQTHAFKRLRHCAIADGFGDSVQSWCYAAALLGTRGVNGDNYRNTVLLNMLLPDIRSVFTDYYLFQQDGAPAHRARDTVTMLQRERERRQSLSLQRCGHLIRQI